MAKVSAAEAQSIAALFSEMRGDSEKAQANLEKMLASQERGVKRLERQFKKLRLTNIKEINKTKNAIKDLVENWESATEAEKKQLPILNKTILEYKRANTGILKLAENTRVATKEQGFLSRAWNATINPLRQLMSTTGAFSSVLDGVIGLYQNWWRLQGLQRQAMGEATMALGGTRDQMEALHSSAMGMRDMFFHVDGGIDGIAITMQHATEVATSMRRSIDVLGNDTVSSITMMGRALAGGTENATQLFRALETGLAGGNRDMNEFGARMMDFASDIGGNAGQLTRDFVASQDALQRFGNDGERVFRDAALMANRFGMETQRILVMMRGFDTFAGASQNVNQLNAMFGTTLSSYEMMMETDPTQRLENVRRALQDSGNAWVDMGYHQRAALAEMTGESENNLARIFGDGISLDQLRSEQAAAERERQQRQDRTESAQDRMIDLFNRTSTTVRDWRAHLQRVYNMVSEALAPIFGVINTHVEGIWDSFVGWMGELRSGNSASEWIQTAAFWVHDMFTAIEEYDWQGFWDGIVATWRSWQPIIVNVRNTVVGWWNEIGGFEGIWERIKTTWDEWKPTIDSVVNTVTTWWKSMGGFEGIWNRVKEIWDEWSPVVTEIKDTVLRIVNFGRILWTVMTGVWGVAGSIWQTFSRISDIMSNIANPLAALTGLTGLITGRGEEGSAGNTGPKGTHSRPRDGGGILGSIRTGLTSAASAASSIIAPESATVSAPSTNRTSGASEVLAAPPQRAEVEFRNLPVIIQMNDREFGRGQIEAAMRSR